MEAQPPAPAVCASVPRRRRSHRRGARGERAEDQCEETGTEPHVSRVPRDASRPRRPFVQDNAEIRSASAPAAVGERALVELGRQRGHALPGQLLAGPCHAGGRRRRRGRVGQGRGRAPPPAPRCHRAGAGAGQVVGRRAARGTSRRPSVTGTTPNASAVASTPEPSICRYGSAITSAARGRPPPARRRRRNARPSRSRPATPSATAPRSSSSSAGAGGMRGLPTTGQPGGRHGHRPPPTAPRSARRGPCPRAGGGRRRGCAHPTGRGGSGAWAARQPVEGAHAGSPRRAPARRGRPPRSGARDRARSAPSRARSRCRGRARAPDLACACGAAGCGAR